MTLYNYQVKVNGKSRVITRKFFFDDVKALDYCKELARSRKCPVRVVPAGKKFGVILDPTKS